VLDHRRADPGSRMPTAAGAGRRGSDEETLNSPVAAGPRSATRPGRRAGVPAHVLRRDGPNNAFVDIQAGSGGTEAQDWAEMLLRMYLRWGERRGFKTELMEASPGEVAGIKSATVRFEGDYAFGWLRTETGVHRPGAQVAVRFRQPAPHLLRGGVRLPGGRRQHRDRDQPGGPAHRRLPRLRRRRPARQPHRVGGAHHPLPTNIVVQCQNDRSQHKNRDHRHEAAQGQALRAGDAEAQRQGRRRWRTPSPTSAGAARSAPTCWISRASRTCAPAWRPPTPSRCWTAIWIPVHRGQPEERALAGADSMPIREHA
jgi:hypothetical protein